MTTENVEPLEPPVDESFQPFYRDIGWEAISPMLVQYFQHRVFGLMGDSEIFKGYVPLKYFKEETLAKALSYDMGRLCAELLLNQMIRDGSLEVDKRQFEGRDYPISVLRRVQK